MNTDSSNDPQLQSLAARLAAAAPRLPDGEAQQLLYQCAFAAGQSAAARKTRRWQAASSALAATLLGVCVFAMPGPLRIAQQPPVADSPSQPEPQEHEDLPARSFVAVRLDAWQARDDGIEKFAHKLAQFKQLEPELRAVALRSLDHAAALQP